MTETADIRNASGVLEQGDPAVDPRAFRRALGQFATGVTVIATSAGDQVVGLTANSFSAVSLDPPLVLWSIRKKSGRAPAFINNGHFTINVLAEDQMELAGMFGRPHEEQFAEIDWTAGRHGDPLLTGAIAHFECVNEAVLDGGDHHILVGRVERFARYDGAPLLFSQGQYGVSSSHPELALTAASAVAPCAEPAEEPLFMSLLQATDHHMSALFQAHRQQVGVTLPTSRVLNRLFRGPCTREVLEQEAFLGENAVENALSDLADEGQVVEAADGTWALTDKGREVRAALRRSAEAFTTAQLRGIPEADLAAAERVLRTLLDRGHPQG
ncbi:flavin oxidoreductase [Micromonospora sonchi]|uniref:Flavin oxidoreductase n=1 Tax=Micromonospora sonchi TaxID=1763543 RepID=A0A917X281_9ACTN|nr:flavin reductase family protein [Micromonospora sonchi]GGM56102.1 flavin oxidoreductase [Micromonospora sonchi]